MRISDWSSDVCSSDLKLAAIPNVVAIKESAPDPRRITDVINRFGDRYTIMAGLDDVALEAMLLGASGWVSDLTSAFPQESVAPVAAVQRGHGDPARAIHRSLLPLLPPPSHPPLAPSPNPAAPIIGLGSHWGGMPPRPRTQNKPTQ